MKHVYSYICICSNAVAMLCYSYVYDIGFILKHKLYMALRSAHPPPIPPAIKNLVAHPVSATDTLEGISLLAFTLTFPIYIFGRNEDVATLNTFTAKIDHSRFNNSCLRLPVSTLVNLIFQSRSFSLGGKIVQQLQYI
jgi:hypothetical protein